MRICIDEYVVQLSEIKKKKKKKVILWFNLLARLIDWNCGNVILTRTQNILQFGWGIFENELQWISGYELVRNSLFFTFFVFFMCSLCSSRILLLFEGLRWKFFSVLEAWIHRVSLICGLLRILEAFELDSSELWDLGRWFGWFLFECSSYSKVEVFEVPGGLMAWF